MTMTEVQRAAFNSAAIMLIESRRVAIVMPTGQGKTLVAVKLAELVKAEKILYVVPTRQLQKHMMSRYNNFRYVTYASLHKYENTISKWDLVILDELHRSGARTYENVVKRVISSSNYSVGLTATRYRFMENKRDIALELFGSNVVDKTEGFPLFPENLTYVGFVHRYDSGRVDFSYSRTIQAVKDYLKDKSKTIIFFSTIEDLEDQLPDIKKIFPDRKIFSVHSKDSSKDRVIEFSREKSAIMCSVNMLNEGVHIDGVDSIVMARKTMSANIYLQQLGRVLAINNKSDPLVIDLVNNFRILSTMFNRANEFRVRLVAGNVLVNKSDKDQALLIINSFNVSPKHLNSSYRRLQSSGVDLYLREWVPLMGEEALMRVDGYDPVSLYNRAMEMGVIKRHKWSNHEKLQLLLFYKEHDMMDKMSRSLLDCLSMARELNISHRWTEYEMDLIYFGEESLLAQIPPHEVSLVKKLLGYK